MKNFLTLALLILPLTLFSANSGISKSTEARTVTVVAPTFTSISLESNVTTLNVGEKAKLTVMGASKELETNIEYIITPSDSIELNGSVLIAKKDGSVTVQAKVGTTLSNTLNLTIAWIVNGHVLPPEPDPIVNNSTLLGIDSNNNGVRDDVEKWIYATYDEYVPCHQELDYNNTVTIDGEVIPSSVQVCEEHPVPYHSVVRAVAMQGARAAQIIIQEPEKARETTVYEDNAQDCQFYLSRLSKENNNSSIGAQNLTIKEFDKAQYNTVQRARAYGKYNFHLSGGVYRLPKSKDMINGCDDNIKNIIKASNETIIKLSSFPSGTMGTRN